MLKSLFVRHKPLYKLFTVLLIVSILFTGGSLTAFAEVQWPESSNLIVKELEEKRTEYSKTYLRNDGQLETVVSATPIHYEENGAWVEYDNTLTEDNNGNLKNNKSPFKVKLPMENGNNKEISLTKDDYSISLKLVGAKNSKANKKVKEENRTSRKNKTAQEMLNDSVVLTNSVTYTNVLDNTDIVYDVKTNTLKESIVLKSQPKKAVSYTYQIRTENLTPILNENGSVSFYDEKDATKLVFYIPAPFMFDSNDVYSYNIKTDLELKNNKATLTYTPDLNWLMDENRVYPVTVDPSVTDKETIQDAYTYSATSKQNEMLGFENQLKVGKSAWLSYCDYFETYIQFPELPEPDEGYVVSNATIGLTVKQLCGTWSTLSIGTYLILEKWENIDTSSYLTYTNRPDCADAPSAVKTLSRGSLAVNSSVSFDVSTLAKYWYKYPETNHGVRLTMENTTEDNWDSIIFYSTENDARYPYLSVTFQPEADVTGIQITDKPANNTFTYFEQMPYHQFTYSLTPSNAKNEDVVWSVSDESVAIISENGLLYAVGAGTVTVSAQLKGNPAIVDSFSLNIVKSPIMSLTLEEVKDIFVGGSFQLTPVIETETAINVNYTYSSSNPRIASVSSTGKVTGISLGTSYITITPVGYPEAAIKVPVNVTNLINNLPENNELEFYEYWQLSTIDGVELTTDKPNLISIQGNGRIRAIEYGSAHVTATLKDEYNEIIAQETCVITITGNLRLNCMPEGNVMNVGETLYLSTDPNFPHELVEWDSSNPEVASLFYKGTGHGWLLNAHSAGTTTLVASVTDPDTGKFYYGYATVWVSNYEIQSIDVSVTHHDKPVVYCGEVFVVRATIIPARYDHDETIWEEDSTFFERVNIPNVDYSNSRYIQYKAKNVEGMTGITFMVNDTIVSIPIEVKKATIDIENQPTLNQMVVGTSHNLDKNIEGAASFKGWSVEEGKEHIAEINKDTGVITAKAPGTVKITAKAQIRNSTASISKSFTLTIGERDFSIGNLPKNLTMDVNDRFTFTISKFPSNGVVHWSTTSDCIEIKDETVYAKKEGTATISFYMEHDNWTSSVKTFTLQIVLPDISITNAPEETVLLINEAYDLGVYYSTNVTNTDVTWSCDKNNIVSVSPEGVITAISPGTAVVTVENTYYDIDDTLTLTVIKSPEVFGDLITCGAMTQKSYNFEEKDGFFISTTPISDILTSQNITSLIDDSNKTFPISSSIYEECYLFACPNTFSGLQFSDYTYGIYRMRNIGVQISFINFNEESLLRCIDDPTTINKKSLYTNLFRTTSESNMTKVDHDLYLQQYFSNVSSEGSYQIAEQYIEFIVNTKCSEDNTIAVPTQYKDFAQDENHRLYKAIENINESAGKTVCDHNKIYISNVSSLNSYEKEAILTTFCGDIDFHQFAAEVTVHSNYLLSPLMALDRWKVATIRADMSIDIHYSKEGTLFDGYYDTWNEIYLLHRRVHNDK